MSHDNEHLSARLEGLLDKQRRAMITSDWSTLAALVSQQEELIKSLSKWDIQPKDKDLLRSIRRSTQRNALLAKSLSSRLGARLQPPKQQTTYTHRGRMNQTSQRLLNLRG